MDGLILVDKPGRCTSHDIVLRVRRALGIRRVGHCGTLDPLATGLILVAVGRATRLFPFLSGTDKTYSGVIRLGTSTDTYDSEGRSTGGNPDRIPDRNGLVSAMAAHEGVTDQIPPPFSAKKFKGKPLYVRARRGEDVPLKPSRVIIRGFQLKDYSPPDVRFEIQCSTGTYIRSLAHDLGHRLGCGAYLTELRRLNSGRFSVREALPPDMIEEMAAEGRTADFLLPLPSLLPEFPPIILTDEGGNLARHGNSLLHDHVQDFNPENRPERELEEAGHFRLFDSRGTLIGYALKKTETNCFHPFFVIETEDPGDSG